MARMVYDEKLGKVVDKSPGRSIYLSNKQWAVLTEYLGLEIEWNELNQFEEAEKELLKDTLTKLYRIGQEVCNHADVK